MVLVCCSLSDGQEKSCLEDRNLSFLWFVLGSIIIIILLQSSVCHQFYSCSSHPTVRPPCFLTFTFLTVFPVNNIVIRRHNGLDTFLWAQIRNSKYQVIYRHLWNFIPILLFTRVKEHYPQWFRQSRSVTTSNPILTHLVNTGLRIDSDKASGVFHQVLPSRPKHIRLRILRIAEPLGSSVGTPTYVHKNVWFMLCAYLGLHQHTHLFNMVTLIVVKRTG